MRLVLQGGHELVEMRVEVVVKLMQHFHITSLSDNANNVILQSHQT